MLVVIQRWRVCSAGLMEAQRAKSGSQSARSADTCAQPVRLADPRTRAEQRADSRTYSARRGVTHARSALRAAMCARFLPGSSSPSGRSAGSAGRCGPCVGTGTGSPRSKARRGVDWSQHPPPHRGDPVQHYRHSPTSRDIPRDLYGIPVIPSSTSVPTPAAAGRRPSRKIRTFLLVAVLGGLGLGVPVAASAFGML